MAVPAGAAPAPSRRARSALVWAGLAVTGGFLYLSLRGLDVSAAWRAARGASPGWLVPSLATLAVAVVMRAARWRYLFAPASRPGLGATLSALLVGQLFNTILPLRAGEAARVVALARRTNGSPTEAAATVLLERALDVLVLLVLLLGCAPWLPHLTWLRTAAVVAVPLALGLAGAAVVLVRFGDRPIELLLAPLRLLPFLDEHRRSTLARSVGLGLAGLRSRGAAVTAVGLTLASWLVLAVSFWSLTLAFHLHVPFLAGVLVVVTTNLGQVVPSSPAALGVFEAATLLAVSAYGIGRAPGLSYAVALHALNVFPYLVAGVVALRITPVARVARERAARPEATP